MDISVLTLFPDMVAGVFEHSIIRRAIDKGIVTPHLINIRDFAADNYKSVDDHPYGGGPGMILRVDVMDRALTHAKNQIPAKSCRSVLMDPQGTPYTQPKAKALAAYDHLILICGHYEGIDERIRNLVDEELSIGDYILTGGELPAMVVADSVARLLPGVLASTESSQTESFSGQHGWLEYPQYTRPNEFKGTPVPDVLLSGNHKAIETWRAGEAKKRTKIRRPDLLRTTKG